MERQQKDKLERLRTGVVEDSTGSRTPIDWRSTKTSRDRQAQRRRVGMRIEDARVRGKNKHSQHFFLHKVNGNTEKCGIAHCIQQFTIQTVSIGGIQSSYSPRWPKSCYRDEQIYSDVTTKDSRQEDIAQHTTAVIVNKTRMARSRNYLWIAETSIPFRLSYNDVNRAENGQAIGGRTEWTRPSSFAAAQPVGVGRQS